MQDTTTRLGGLVRYLMTTCGGRDMLVAMEELQLSLSQLKILDLLEESTDELSLKQLADHFGLSLPATSRAVEGLVQRKLVTRSEDAEDRRMKRVRPTERGHALIQGLIALRAARLEEFVAGLSSRERSALDRALGLLLEREEIAAMCPRGSDGG